MILILLISKYKISNIEIISGITNIIFVIVGNSLNLIIKTVYRVIAINKKTDNPASKIFFKKFLFIIYFQVPR